MQVMSAPKAKRQFGRLFGAARVQRVAIAKQGPPVVVVVAIEEHKGLKAVTPALQ